MKAVRKKNLPPWRILKAGTNQSCFATKKAFESLVGALN
jgi:hypothetical protein